MERSDVDPRAELRAIAARARASVRARNHRHPAADAPFDEEVRFRHDGRRVSWSTNGAAFLIEIEAPCAITFAAGRPDLVLHVREPIAEAGSVALYVSGSLERGAAERWLQDAAHLEMVSALRLAGDEQLLVARNRSTVLVGAGGTDEDWARLERLLELVAACHPHHRRPRQAGPSRTTAIARSGSRQPATRSSTASGRRWGPGSPRSTSSSPQPARSVPRS